MQFGEETVSAFEMLIAIWDCKKFAVDFVTAVIALPNSYGLISLVYL